MNHFSIGLWCAMKSRFYTKTSDNQLSGWTEKKLQSTSQSQACTKKGVMVTVRWSAAGLTHYNFPNPSKPLPKRVCSANRWDAQKTETAAASTGEQSGPNSATTPNHTLHNQRFKSWTNWAEWSVASSAIFTWPLTNWLALLLQAPRHHFQGKRFHHEQEAENAFQEFIESWSTDFYATEIDFFLPGKNDLIVMVPILTNKDVFELNLNDLKFRVWNYNYFCTNLIF